MANRRYSSRHRNHSRQPLQPAMPGSEADERRQRILSAIRAVPRGHTASYGQIARRSGYPRCARLVARLLSESTEPLPWHRIVRSDGRIAFPVGSEGFDEQCGRLRAEGVTVQSGKVRLVNDDEAWLDRMLWGEAATRSRR